MQNIHRITQYNNDLNEIVQVMGGVRSPLSGKRVLVTGGTGFLGRWIVDSLLLLGVKVVVVSRSVGNALCKMPCWQGEANLTLLSYSGLKRECFEIDYVIHCATDYRHEPLETLTLAENVYDFAKKVRAKRVVFLSSGAASAIEAQRTNYGVGKVLAENSGMRLFEAGSFEFLVLRGYSFLGPFQDLGSNFAVTQFFSSVLEGRPMVIAGDGASIRSYLYPVDFVLGLIKVLVGGRAGEIYEIGSEEPVEIRELARMINELRIDQGIEVVTKFSGTSSLSGSARYLPNLNKIKDHVGFRQSIFLCEAIYRTALFYQTSDSSCKIVARNLSSSC